MRVLLTFVGFHDPYYHGDVEGVELKGPILYLLGLRSFDRVYLYSAPNTLDVAQETRRAIEKTRPGTAVVVERVDIDDPIHYDGIRDAVRNSFARVRGECADAEYFISTASGTPQMHAVWLLLASSGEIPARILQTRPPKFVTTDKPAVEEIDAPRFAVSAEQEPRHDATPPSDAEVLEGLGIVGRHPAFRTALDNASRFARSPLPVLIQGETGTGKELVARYIHRLSGIPADRIQVVNCASLPRELAESLLFGHVRGSFTGAVADQKGAFELADGGTLFLDEIGELTLEVQAKLLRVLQDGVVQPLGAAQGRKVHVRLVAATNQDLKAMVAARTFREDLYYRIEVGIISLPPLRQRRSDIPLLATAALENASLRLSRPKRFTPEAVAALVRRDWPGNVRNLMNVIERTAQLTRGELIDEKDLQFSDDGGARRENVPEPHVGFDVQAWLDEAHDRLFERALEVAGGNASAAARLLNVTPQAVSKWLGKGGAS